MPRRPLLAELAARRRARTFVETAISEMPDHVFEARLAEMAAHLSGERRREPPAEKPLSDEERGRWFDGLPPGRRARICEVLLATKRERGDPLAKGLERVLAKFAWWRDRPGVQPAVDGA